jgi:hypothetical protein|tara:strand:+ start:382 stop:651 length:270 start_codon:yes stop_codon:yes gene_type:complete
MAKYLIIPKSEIDKENHVLNLNELSFSVSDDTSLWNSFLNSLQYNNNNTKTFIKWESDSDPSFISNIENSEGPYTSDEMTNILATSEWS